MSLFIRNATMVLWAEINDAEMMTNVYRSAVRYRVNNARGLIMIDNDLLMVRGLTVADVDISL